ncbi:MAG: FHA domain-containing protein [Planctomycetes bacterium]|nr:FHA domain-containing protein [Planctomycetota bacterium]
MAIDSVREHKANSCPKCGASFRANDIFCGDCGHGLRKASDEDQDWAPESKRRDHCAEPPPTPGHADEVTRVVPLHVESQPTTFRLVVVGAGREAIDLTKDVTVLGSGDVDVVIKTDAYLDRRHCLLSYRKGRLYLVDQESANGTLRRLRRGERCRLRNGMRVCFAGHLMRFERRAPAESTNPTSTELLGGERDVAPACFVEVLMRGRHGDLRFLESGVSSIGRGSDQVLQLNADPAISRAHAHVLLEEDEFFLIDGSADGHASSAGTFVEIDEEVELKVGDAFRAGKREFLIEG